MIDTLLSKLGLTMAVIIIVGVLLSLFALQQEGFRNEEIEVTADSVQMRVDELSSLSAETTVPIIHGGEQAGEAVVLPRDIMGDPYKMDLYPTAVLINQDGRMGRATFQHTVHLFFPGDTVDFTPTDLESLDEVFDRLRVTVDQDLVLQRRYLPSSGYQTFIYLAGSESSQSVADGLAERIDSHAHSGKGTWDIGCSDCEVAVLPNFVCARGEGYSCVAKIHVNHTYDPEAVWGSGGTVEIEEYTEKSNANNKIVEVEKGGSFVLERYYVSVKVRTYVVGSETPVETTMMVIQSFAYGG